MRTVNEISNYINSKEYYDKVFDFSSACSKVVETLKNDEEVLFACASSTFFNGKEFFKTGVMVITNERMVYAVKTNTLFKTTIVKSITLDYVSDVTKTVPKNLVLNSCTINVDCRNEKIAYWVSYEKLDEMYGDVNNAIDQCKSKKIQGSTVISALSSADELKKFKELLDMGVITQEEFDAKKKQLLGL